MKNIFCWLLGPFALVVLGCAGSSGDDRSAEKLIGTWQDRHGVLVGQFFADHRFTRYAINDRPGTNASVSDTLKYTGTYEVIGDMLHTTDEGSTSARTYKLEFQGDSAVTMTGEQISLTFYRAR